MADRTRILSGMRPTGRFHLGNYLGAAKNWVERQDRYECFYFVADYHALNAVRDPEALKHDSYEVAACWLALGLDPAKTVFYRQSDVPEIFERTVLSQLLSGFNFNYLLVGTSHNGAPRNLILAGMAATGPEPPQPVHSVQPAPQNSGERPQYHPTRFYQPRPPPPAPHAQPRDRSPRDARGQTRGQSPRGTRGEPSVRTPQEILKQLEAMRARQQGNASQ